MATHIARDPHGVSITDNDGFVRWQSAPNPEVARQIYRELLGQLQASQRSIPGLPEHLIVGDLSIIRVENSTTVETTHVPSRPERAG